MTATTIDCPMHGQQDAQNGECWLCAANRRNREFWAKLRAEKKSKQREIAFRQLNDNDKE